MKYEVNTYNVGQGLFNLVRIFDDNNSECLFCGIFDCGSIANPARTQNDVIEKAADYLKERCDCIVISHQDRDHWSYLKEVLRLSNEEIKLDTWYIRHGIDEYVRIMQEGITSYVETFYTRPFPKGTTFTRSCTTSQYSASLTRRMYEKNQFKMEIEAGVDDITAKLYITGGKAKGVVYYEKIWLSGTNEYDDTVAEVNLRDKIRGYIHANPDIFGIKNMGEPEGLLDEICKVLDCSIPDTIDDYEVIDSQIPIIVLGGAYPSHNYKALGKFMSLLGRVRYEVNALFFNKKLEPIFGEIAVIHNLSDYSGQSYIGLAIRRNATSTITCFGLGGKNILFPGDATIHTFGNMKEWLYDSKVILLDYITAPHHGSYKTNIVLNNEGNRSTSQPVISFFEELRPRTVVVSAWHEKYGHPHCDVVAFMEECAEKLIGKHKIGVCYSLDNYNDYTAKDCEKKLYTTELSGDIIWKDGDVETQFNGCENRKRFLPPYDMFICRNGVRL